MTSHAYGGTAVIISVNVTIILEKILECIIHQTITKNMALHIAVKYTQTVGRRVSPKKLPP